MYKSTQNLEVGQLMKRYTRHGAKFGTILRVLKNQYEVSIEGAERTVRISRTSGKEFGSNSIYWTPTNLAERDMLKASAEKREQERKEAAEKRANAYEEKLAIVRESNPEFVLTDLPTGLNGLSFVDKEGRECFAILKVSEREGYNYRTGEPQDEYSVEITAHSFRWADSNERELSRTSGYGPDLDRVILELVATFWD